jgi:hypothetical protein
MQDIGIHPLNLSPQAFYSYEAQPRWMDAPSPHPDPTCRPGLSTCFGRIHVAAAARPPTCWVCHPVSSGDPALCAVTWGGAYACNYVHTYKCDGADTVQDVLLSVLHPCVRECSSRELSFIKETLCPTPMPWRVEMGNLRHEMTWNCSCLCFWDGPLVVCAMWGGLV